MKKLLSEINKPEDVKKIPKDQLNLLASEIREFLIESVSKTGGHLASNLGVVELTLSLFRVFNLEKDKIIWDVGHQSYVHKILTGRKEGFKTLRKFGGMSGFPKACESKYDVFDTGHSSTSISAALGMARARDILGKDNHVVAVIGDGALTGGMAIEALNDAGYNKTKLIVILNDNQMSISKNVGGLSTYLSNLRSNPNYNKLKNDISNTLNQSNVGKNLASSISKIKDSIKQLVVPSMLFEDMGIKYLGPIDGHDMVELTNIFSKAKQIDGPVIIHTITQKGKGYDFAEQNPNKFHGIGPFDCDSGELCSSSTNSYSSTFGNTLIKLREKHDNLVAITAAMPDGTGLKNFAKKYPNSFFDVGIAEQHAVTLAAGMAKEGLRPVFAVYSTFLQRAYDQILHDICIQKLPVTIAIDRAGIVGEDGETHQGVFDLSFLRHMPNINILAPKCMAEMEKLLEWALSVQEPVAIRYPRGGDLKELDIKPLNKVVKGKWEVVSDGGKIALICVGRMVQHALQAKELLKNKFDITIINATFVKPMDLQILNNLSSKGYDIVTIEDNMIQGGFGEGVLNYLNSINHKGKVVNLGYKDEFIPHGDTAILYKLYKLDGEGIKNEILKLI